jgi:hypothetical protein
MHRIIIIAFGLMAVGLCLPVACAAEPSSFRLPYPDGEAFVVSQGYHALPTHVHKDDYALDFTQIACEAYGKPAVAAASGTVLLAEETGYNGGYGTQVLVEHDNVVSRYAHLVSDSVRVHSNDVVAQGTALGEIGDTGLVAGNACLDHPGTHLHFAAYVPNSDGTYAAQDPEPLSGYRDITEGDWYEANGNVADASRVDLSDAATSGGGLVAGAHTSAPEDGAPMPDIGSQSPSVFFGVTDSSPSQGQTSSMSSSSAALSSSSSSSSLSVTVGSVSISSGGGGGGGSVYASIVGSPTADSVPPSQNISSSTPVSADSSSTAAESTSTTPFDEATTTASSTASSSININLALAPPATIAGAGTLGGFNSSTLAIDFAWQTPANASGSISYSIFDLGAATGTASSGAPLWSGSSTSFSLAMPADGASHEFAIQATDAAGNSSVATTSVTTPPWLAVIQPEDDANSMPSWYSDTWYDLGTGFYGTIRSLTLKGHVTPTPYFASHLSLDEFLDAGYTIKNQTFDISDDAPFTANATSVTISGLDIHLQPNKYYRLDGYNEYQNRSIVLLGTAATGTAMANSFAPGFGRVEYRYQFYPYLAWTFIPNWPALAPPNPPPGLATSFDLGGSALNINWGVATDPDTVSTLLTYEYAVSTSTSLDGATWQPVGQSFSARVPVIYPNSYLVAVRARDDFGNVSAPAAVSWNFPADYDPSNPWRGMIVSDASLPTSTVEYGSNYNFGTLATPLRNFPSSFSGDLFIKLYVQDVSNPGDTAYSFPLVGWDCGGWGCDGDRLSRDAFRGPVGYYLSSASSTQVAWNMHGGVYNDYVVAEFGHVSSTSPLYLTYYGGGSAHFWGTPGGGAFYCAATTLADAWNCPLGGP